MSWAKMAWGGALLALVLVAAGGVAGCGQSSGGGPEAGASATSSATVAPRPGPTASAAALKPLPERPARFTALVGGTVYDATGTRGPIPQGVVVLEGDRIKAVGPKAKVTIPEGAERVDLAEGQWVVPGLIDAHIHFFQSAGLYTRPDIVDLREVRPYADDAKAIQEDLELTFRRYLASGVTAVVDMGGPMWNFDVRQRAGGMVGAPRVAVAGPLIATVSRPQLDLGDPPIIEATSPGEGRRLVREQLAKKPDLIKIWFIVLPGRDAAELEGIARAVIGEAHAAGVRVAVHATELESARTVVEAGADILVHSIHDAPVDAALLGLLKERSTIYIPTLAVMAGYAEVLGGKTRLEDIEERYGDPKAIGSWEEMSVVAPKTPEKVLEERLQKLAGRLPMMRENLAKVRAAGVVIAAGTDAGNIGTLHGPSLHRELELMVAAGMTPEQVVLAATRDAALVMAKKPEVGTLEPGKLADLLVLDADPLADITGLRRLHRVVKGGVVLEPGQILASNPAAVVQGQLDAYNARDVAKFVSYYAPDVEVLRQPSGQVVARGRDAMRSKYAELFQASPKLHCRLIHRVVEGAVVVDHELVTGMRDRPPVHAVASYRVADGLIRQVWFLEP